MWMCPLCLTHQRACSSHQGTLPSYKPHLQPVMERRIHVIACKIFFCEIILQSPWLSNSVIKQGDGEDRSHIKEWNTFLSYILKWQKRWFIIAYVQNLAVLSFIIILSCLEATYSMGSVLLHLIYATTYYRVYCIVLGLPAWARE